MVESVQPSFHTYVTLREHENTTVLETGIHLEKLVKSGKQWCGNVLLPYSSESSVLPPAV
jgi:hypothetical protein